MSTENQNVGLFPANFRITAGSPEQPIVGGVNLMLSLMVYTPNKTVTGFAKITQTTNPPLDEASKVSGEYTYMTVMPNTSHILVTASGYPNINWNPNWGVGPQLQPNFELRMVLESDWQSGRASFKFRDASGKWVEENNFYVEAIDVKIPEEAKAVHA